MSKQLLTIGCQINRRRLSYNTSVQLLSGFITTRNEELAYTVLRKCGVLTCTAKTWNCYHICRNELQWRTFERSQAEQRHVHSVSGVGEFTPVWNGWLLRKSRKELADIDCTYLIHTTMLYGCNTLLFFRELRCLWILTPNKNMIYIVKVVQGRDWQTTIWKNCLTYPAVCLREKEYKNLLAEQADW